MENNSFSLLQYQVLPKNDAALHEQKTELNRKPHEQFVDIQSITIHDGSIAQSHIHEFLEVLLCQEGCVEYRFETGKIRVQKGDFLFIPPGVRYQLIFPKGSEIPYRRISIQVGANASSIVQEFEKISLGTSTMYGRCHLLRTAGTSREYLTSFCETIYTEAKEKRLGWECILFGNTFILIGLMRRAVEEDMIRAYDQQLMLYRILRYIENSLNQKITLADTAHRFLVSESYISKLFRNQMNTSFYRYVIQQRLIAARRLISEGIPFDRVASQTGFCDRAAFYRAFKREYGISPQEYKTSLTSTTKEFLHV